MTDYAIYARKSIDKTGAGLSVADQVAECRKYANEHDLTVVRVFQENNVSAAVYRPLFEELKTLVEQGKVTGIICADTDRLWRFPKDLEPVLALVDTYNLDVRATRTAMIDLSTPQGKYVARLMTAGSAFEVEHAKQRMLAGHMNRAARGVWRGGVIPYGYQRSATPGMLDLHPERADQVRKAAHDVLKGKSIIGITADWNRRGITTTHGKKWRATGLRKLLVAPVIAGLVTHKGEIIGPGQWPGIITPEDHERLKVIFNDPARRTNTQGTERVGMLSGVAVCGKCGDKLGKNRDGRSRNTGPFGVYRCQGCYGVQINSDSLDAYVNGLIVEHLKNEVEKRHTFEDDDQTVSLADLMKQRDELHDRQERLTELFATGGITERQLVKGNETIGTEVQAIEDRISNLSQVNPLKPFALPAFLIEQAWRSADPDQKARAIKNIMRVTVNPAGRGNRPPVSDRVVIAWK